eukprot:scaffold182_cov350-Prasinococcus_capsulatus_cf.AAC.26
METPVVYDPEGPIVPKECFRKGLDYLHGPQCAFRCDGRACLAAARAAGRQDASWKWQSSRGRARVGRSPYGVRVCVAQMPHVPVHAARRV